MTIQDFGIFSFPGEQREVFPENRAPDPCFFHRKKSQAAKITAWQAHNPRANFH